MITNLEISQYLLSMGVRPSLQRIEIMSYLRGVTSHPTADEVYDALVVAMPTLSKTTVYNTLKLFVYQGAAIGIGIDARQMRFDGDLRPHAHFLCRRCGALEDVFSESCECSETSDAARKQGFEVESVQVFLSGVCSRCNNRNN